MALRNLNFHNNYNLGDCLSSLHYITNISALHNVHCTFACKPEYHSQLIQFVDGYDVSIVSDQQNNSVDMWGYSTIRHMQNDGTYPHRYMSAQYNTYTDVGKVLLEVYKRISEQINLECPFVTCRDIIFNQKCFNTDRLYDNYDYLIINSDCLSGQLKGLGEYLTNEISAFINNKSKTHRIITTKKVDNIPCTTDDNMSLVDIGILAKTCRIVTGFPTSPLWACINIPAVKKIERYYNITGDSTTFDYNEKFHTQQNFNLI